MKTIIVDFSSDKHCDIAVELARRSFEILYWTGKKQVTCLEKDEKVLFYKTIFHDTYDAVAGLPATSMDTSIFEPVSKELLIQMSLYEGQALAMMSKLNYTKMSLAEQLHHYYQLLWYWYGVLMTLKPEVIIFADVPHTIYNYIIYRLAKILKIKTVIFKRINAIPDKVLFFEDYEDYQEIKTEYEEVKKSGQIGDFVREYYDKFNKINSVHQPEQYKRFNGLSGKEKGVESLPRLSSVIKNLKQATLLKATIGFFWMLFHKMDMLSLKRLKEFGLVLRIKNFEYRKICRGFKREYERLQTKNVDLKRPFIYLPLHRQPEGTTNPMGGVFDDQLLMIEILYSALPKGWVLYVKEHPTQWKFPLAHLGRYEGYYKAIKKNKNIILLPTSVSSFSLIDSCKAVATVTGTAGMEAIMHGKPAIVFGCPLYMDCEGVLKVENYETCKLAMKKIEDNFIPNKLEVLQYLQAIENITENAYIHSRHGIYSAYNYNQSKNNIVNGLCRICLK